MSLNEILRDKREEILKIAAKHGAYNVRIFGSVARGEADELSDIDFLVELEPIRTPFFPGGLVMDLGRFIGRDGRCRNRKRSEIPYPRAGSQRGGTAMRDDRERLQDILSHRADRKICG